MITSAVLVALFAALQAAPAPQRADSLFVDVAGRVTVLREADLAGLARDSLRVAFHGQAAHTYTGVRLVDVLRLAGVPIDSLHAPATTSRVVIEAADGYRVIALDRRDDVLAMAAELVATRAARRGAD